MNGFETDRGNLITGLKASCLGVGQLVQTLLNRDSVVRDFRRNLVAGITDFNKAIAAGSADTFDATACQLLLAVHVEQAILETG